MAKGGFKVKGSNAPEAKMSGLKMGKAPKGKKIGVKK